MSTAKIGTKIDQLIRLQDAVSTQQLAVKKEEDKLAKLKRKQQDKEDEIFNLFPKEKLTGAFGKLGSVEVNKKEIPTVESWDKLYAYIHRNKAYDMLQKRLSTAAANERWNAGKAVPGVGKFTRLSLKIKRFKQ